MNTQKHKIHESDNNMLLQSLFKTACQKHEIPENVQAKLITDGTKQFAIFSDGSVTPTAGYKTVDEFIEQHRHDKQSENFAGKNTKEQLLEEMARHARAGNMSAYRLCRKQYNDCS